MIENESAFLFVTRKIMKEGWEAIIGMEIHAQLATMLSAKRKSGGFGF